MAEHFTYYDDWKSAILKCPKCGWTGTFDEGSVEHHDKLMDSSCPVCDWFSAPMLAIVSYPTLEESLANWGQLTECEKYHVNRRKRFLSAWESSKLRTEAELPDLEGCSLVLSWDFEVGGSGRFTIIRCGVQEVWREPAVFEGHMRFKEIVDILKRKYGSRLADIVPTPMSETYLYGDDLWASDAVESVRQSIWDSHRAQ